MIGVELRLFEEGGDVVIVDSVLDAVAVPPHGFHQAPISKETQLVRNGGLGHANGEGEIADAERTSCQRIQDLCPRRIAQGVESTDDKFEDFRLG